MVLTVMRRRSAPYPAILGGVILLSALCGVWTYTSYRADLAAAQQGLLAGSRIAATACGPIEYAAAGTGPAVLLIHGSGGGYSQVAGVGELLASAGFRAVAMSRFGYLRTPMPRDASAEAQADAHACLLDALDLRAAVALGVSAGAPSAMQFCLRHPDHCSGLVLLVPAAHVPQRAGQGTSAPSPLLQFVVDHVLTSDFVMWSITRLWPELLVKTALATPIEVFEASSPAERQRALALAEEIFPVSGRVRGLKNDAAVVSTLPRYPLERLDAPTLVISVEDDLYGTATSARYTAAHIPGARLVIYPSGGHVWLGRDDEVRGEIVAFLRR